ncbi:hypothetical protein ABLE82_19290 [Xanthobacter sp. VNH20]
MQESITAWAIISAFGGSIIGAAIGGLINFILQRNSLAAAKKQRDDDRDDKRRAYAFSLYVKLIRIYSDLGILWKAVSGSLKKAEAKGFEGSLFQIIVPITPLPSNIQFSAEELAIILSIDDKLFNKIASLDQLHTSTISLFALYAEKRASLLDRLGADMMGEVGTSVLTKEQRLWFDPQAFQLNQIAEYMIARSRDDSEEVWTALELLNCLLEKHFKYKFELKKIL